MHGLRTVAYAGSVLSCLLLLAGCSFPGSVKPTVKIGLSAPFEGLYRDLGYEALYGARLAVRERNAAGGVGQRFLVELVALNDFGEADKAVVQARKMAVDSQILGVLGGFFVEGASVAGEYERLGLTYLTPTVDITREDALVTVDADFESSYADQSGGAEPGPVAVWAYSTANRLLDAIDTVVRAGGQPSRSRVQSALK
jgi:ABC-type branched-subunit amino acid transport system substrate-binding protein